jgi:hypothetical protein
MSVPKYKYRELRLEPQRRCITKCRGLRMAPIAEIPARGSRMLGRHEHFTVLSLPARKKMMSASGQTTRQNGSPPTLPSASHPSAFHLSSHSPPLSLPDSYEAKAAEFLPRVGWEDSDTAGVFFSRSLGLCYPVTAAEKNVAAACEPVRAVGLPAGELHDRELCTTRSFCSAFTALPDGRSDARMAYNPESGG